MDIVQYYYRYLFYFSTICLNLLSLFFIFYIPISTAYKRRKFGCKNCIYHLRKESNYTIYIDEENREQLNDWPTGLFITFLCIFLVTSIGLV